MRQDDDAKDEYDDDQVDSLQEDPISDPDDEEHGYREQLRFEPEDEEEEEEEVEEDEEEEEEDNGYQKKVKFEYEDEEEEEDHDDDEEEEAEEEGDDDDDGYQEQLKFDHQDEEEETDHDDDDEEEEEEEENGYHEQLKIEYDEQEEEQEENEVDNGLEEDESFMEVSHSLSRSMDILPELDPVPLAGAYDDENSSISSSLDHSPSRDVSPMQESFDRVRDGKDEEEPQNAPPEVNSTSPSPAIPFVKRKSGLFEAYAIENNIELGEKKVRKSRSIAARVPRRAPIPDHSSGEKLQADDIETSKAVRISRRDGERKGVKQKNNRELQQQPSSSISATKPRKNKVSPSRKSPIHPSQVNPHCREDPPLADDSDDILRIQTDEGYELCVRIYRPKKSTARETNSSSQSDPDHDKQSHVPKYALVAHGFQPGASGLQWNRFAREFIAETLHYVALVPDFSGFGLSGGVHPRDNASAARSLLYLKEHLREAESFKRFHLLVGEGWGAGVCIAAALVLPMASGAPMYLRSPIFKDSPGLPRVEEIHQRALIIHIQEYQAQTWQSSARIAKRLHKGYFERVRTFEEADDMQTLSQLFDEHLHVRPIPLPQESDIEASCEKLSPEDQGSTFITLASDISSLDLQE